MGKHGTWMIYGPIVAGTALPLVVAYLGNWQPWEIVALVAVLAVPAALVGGAWAWYAVQARRAELVALSSDEQAARLLGEALGRCGPFLSAVVAKEVWDAFATLASESK